MELWQRLLVIGIVLALTAVAARLLDRRIMGADRSPEALTRYRILRRSLIAATVFAGVLSALLVIPGQGRRGRPARVVGRDRRDHRLRLAAHARQLRRRRDDRDDAAAPARRLGRGRGVEGSVEEIGLMYTFIRTGDNARLVIPNEKLASDTIRNSTIRSAAKYAEVTVQVPYDRPSPARRGARAEAPEAGRGLHQLARGVADPDGARLDRERGRGRAAGARPAPACTGTCVSSERSREPPRRSGGRGLDDEVYARKRRKRSGSSGGRAGAVPSSCARRGHHALFVAAGAAVTSVVAFGADCDLKTLRPVSIGQNSFIYAADNSILGAIPAEKNRQPVPLKRISAWMPKATVAIEDRRFYEHGGVDVEGIARALWKNVNAGEVVEGGSITQQLVRNLYIVSREQTVERKLKEACLAIKLDDAW